MALWLGREVDHVWRRPTTPGRRDNRPRPRPGRGEDRGKPGSDRGGRVTGMNATDWPPSFSEARAEPLEAIGLVVERLGTDESQYDGSGDRPREILGHPRLAAHCRSAIARALGSVPRLDRQDIAALCPRRTTSPSPPSRRQRRVDQAS